MGVWDAILGEALAPQDFSPRSVTALINLCGLFSISDDRVERAVELMRFAGHRFDGDVDQEMRENIFTGLAGVTRANRNTALADELRVVVRKNRIDFAHPPKAQREFLIAIAAAAAHTDFDGWSAYLGKWADEPAFSVLDKQGNVLGRFNARGGHGSWVDAHGDIYVGTPTSVDKYVRNR